jgi:hypothetical protein
MKKSSYLFSLVFFALVFASCGGDGDTVDYAWKAANESAFNVYQDSVNAYPGVFAEVSIPGGPGKIYRKILNKTGDEIGTKIPTQNSDVRVTYTGWLQTTGLVFDASSGAKFNVSAVISGWQTALQHMKEGEHWRIWIPWELGYGSSGNGSSIPGYSTLTFDLLLEKIVKE